MAVWKRDSAKLSSLFTRQFYQTVDLMPGLPATLTQVEPDDENVSDGETLSVSPSEPQ